MAQLPEFMSCHNIVFRAPNGAQMSIAVGRSSYCTPRENNGPHTHVEVGFPTGHIPRSWDAYADATFDGNPPEIYAWLPVELLGEWFTLNANPLEIVRPFEGE